MKISERDRNLIEAIKKFFRENKPQRVKLKPMRLSDPESKADLMKIMDKVKAKNLLQIYSIFTKKKEV